MQNLTLNINIGGARGSVQATNFEEWCMISSLLGEVDRAVEKVAKAAGVAKEAVQIVYRRDLQTKDGRKFNKITLRAYNNGKSYSMDFGSTDKNPLGFYISVDDDVQEYDVAAAAQRKAQQVQQPQAPPAQYAPQPQAPQQWQQPQGAPQQWQGQPAPAPAPGYAPPPAPGYAPQGAVPQYAWAPPAPQQ